MRFSAAANIIQKLNFDTLKAIFLLNYFTNIGLNDSASGALHHYSITALQGVMGVMVCNGCNGYNSKLD